MSIITIIDAATPAQRAEVWNILGPEAKENHILLAIQTALNDADESEYFDKQIESWSK